MKNFKDFINERRGNYLDYRTDETGLKVARVKRHHRPNVGASNATNPNMRFAHRVVPQAHQAKEVIKPGNLTQQQAEKIADTHGLNLQKITTTSGATLRGTNPQEILLRNPEASTNPKCPFPFIKKIK